MSSILITGANGNVGSEVAKHLTQKNIPFFTTTHKQHEVSEGKVYFDFEQAQTFYEVAKIFSEELGRTISYAHPTIWQFRKHMLAKGIPSAYVNVTSVIYLTTILGLAKRITPELTTLLGRPPKTVREYVHDYREQL